MQICVWAYVFIYLGLLVKFLKLSSYFMLNFWELLNCFPFHTVHGVLKQEWFAIPYSSGPHSVRPLHHGLTILGWPHMACLSFIELDKTVVLWSDWLVVCDCDFSMSALLQHLPSYLGFFYLWRGVSLHCCSSKAQPLLLTSDAG